MKHDDEDDDDVFDEDGILLDGKGVRCPVQFMDTVQRAIYQDSHRPGWRVPDRVTHRDEQVGVAYSGYLEHLRGGPNDPPAKPKRKKLTLDAARADAEQAYQERSAWLRDAHKQGRP